MALEATQEIHPRLHDKPRSVRAPGLTPFLRPRTLRGKLILLSLGVALASSLLVAGVSYVHIAEVTQARAVERLASDARVLAAQTAGTFDHFLDDAVLLSRMPPVEGIIRASRSTAGVDPVDGSTVTLWRQRLEVIFTQFLRARRPYTQARYIGVADNGREIVRVNREGSAFRPVPWDELQEKGGEPYLRQSFALRPGQYLFSEITYNREHGIEDVRSRPTIRIVLPVFDDDRTLSGFVVLNADYATLLRQVFAAAPVDRTLTILNQAGDYLVSDPHGGAAAFHFSRDADWQPPPFFSAIKESPEREMINRRDDEIDYTVQIPIGSSARRTSLAIVASVSRTLFLEDASLALRRNLLFAGALVLLAALGAALLGAELTRPLRRLTAEIGRRSSNLAPIHLRIDAGDEIGDLARAFQGVSNDLIASAEQARASEARLNALFKTAPIGLLTTDRTGIIRSANRTLALMFGYTIDDLVGEPVATLIPARFQEGHAAKITGFVAAGVPGELVMAAGREVRGARRNGSELPLEVGLNSATMADGSVEIIAAVQDVTERKRNQIRTELLKAVAFAGQEDWTMDQILGRTLRQICETVSWPIGHIYLWDDARQRLVPSGIWHVDDHVKARVGAFQAARAQAEFEPGKGLPGRVYETGQGAWIEDIALDPNFPRLDLMPTTDLHAAFAIPVQLAGQTRAVLEFFDVNVVPRDPDLVVVMDAIGRQLGRALDRRAAQDELRGYAEALARSNTDLDEFAYVASHDLKAPLRVIDNASKWLEEDLGEHLDEDSRENMQLLRGRVQRMEKLLDDLLDYSRVGRKTDRRFTDSIPGNALLDDVLSLLTPPEAFAVVVDEAFAGITVNRMPLQQIFLNLIGNAVKHHHRETGRIEVTVEDQGDCFAFAIKDDGPGIPPDFHDQVFKMFQTLKPRDQVEGSGMGLAMVRKQIEVFNGSLTLESADGQGCCFRFTWPKRQQINSREPSQWT